MKKLSLLAGIASVFSLNSISAYGFNNFNWLNFSFTSPSDFLNNEWVLFIGIFLLSFSVIYLSLSNVFGREKKNEYFPWVRKESMVQRGPVVAISMVMSFFIASALSQKAMIYGYFGNEIGSWIILFGGILAFIFIAKVANDAFKPLGIPIVLIVTWVILRLIDPYAAFPSAITYNIQFENIYSIATSYITLTVLIILAFFLTFKTGKSGGK